MSSPKRKIMVAMSGGVDSSVAAALLVREGHEVTGAFMKNWSDEADPCTGDCAWKKERQDALRVATSLGIPFETFDFEEEYRRDVVDYMVKEYAAGRTPNPDVMCNSKVKFNLFLKKALERGADMIATGHYARIARIADNSSPEAVAKGDASRNGESFQLLAGVDTNKDQSYFLHRLTQEQLSRSLFPVGHLQKPEVRRIAAELGLSTADKKDSQGICFIGQVDLAEFLGTKISGRPGDVVTADGRVVGKHDGIAPYTIGQRHGLGIGGGPAYFVTAKDVAANTITVSQNESDLDASALVATDAHWIAGAAPALPLRVRARIRYRQPLQECVVAFGPSGPQDHRTTGTNGKSSYGPVALRSSIVVSFSATQRAISPGQFVVFYDGDRCLGGAVIAARQD